MRKKFSIFSSHKFMFQIVFGRYGKLFLFVNVTIIIFNKVHYKHPLVFFWWSKNSSFGNHASFCIWWSGCLKMIIITIIYKQACFSCLFLVLLKCWFNHIHSWSMLIYMGQIIYVFHCVNDLTFDRVLFFISITR